MNTVKCNKDKIGNFDIPDNVVLSSIIQYPPGFLFVPGEILVPFAGAVIKHVIL